MKILGWDLLGSFNIFFETIRKHHIFHLCFPQYVIGSIKFDREHMIEDLCGNWSVIGSIKFDKEHMIEDFVWELE